MQNTLPHRLSLDEKRRFAERWRELSDKFAGVIAAQQNAGVRARWITSVWPHQCGNLLRECLDQSAFLQFAKSPEFVTWDLWKKLEPMPSDVQIGRGDVRVILGWCACIRWEIAVFNSDQFPPDWADFFGFVDTYKAKGIPPIGPSFLGNISTGDRDANIQYNHTQMAEIQATACTILAKMLEGEIEAERQDNRLKLAKEKSPQLPVKASSGWTPGSPAVFVGEVPASNADNSVVLTAIADLEQQQLDTRDEIVAKIDNKKEPSPAKKKRGPRQETQLKIDAAQIVKKNNPTWSLRKVAQDVGLPHSTLARNDDFMDWWGKVEAAHEIESKLSETTYDTRTGERQRVHEDEEVDLDEV